MNEKLETIKVLLIEDNVWDVDLIKIMLKSTSEESIHQESYEISSVDSLKKGQEFLATNQIDVILLDLSLPDSQGIDSCSRIYDQDSDIPVIVLTGNQSEDIVIQSAKTGIQNILIKGQFDKSILKREILYSIERQNLIKNLKRSEEELKYSREQLYDVIEKNSDAMIVVNADGVVQFLNTAAEKIFDRKHEDFIGQPFGFSIVAGKTTEIEILTKSKKVILGEMSMAKVTWKGEGAYLASVRDITERKKIQEALLRSSQLESIGTLAGGIAHDFNNFLTAIMGGLSLAKEYLNPDDPSFEILEVAEKASDRAAALAQQLLTFSKGGEPVKGVVSLISIIQESVNFTLSGSNVKSHLNLSEDLWFCDVDAGKIVQVFNNLFLNACQAMPSGGDLYIDAENMVLEEKPLNKELLLHLKPGKIVKISVKDTGVGIDKKVLEKIFNPFFTTKEMGSGLGLATAYSILIRHFGFLNAESELNKGTTFHIYLPASERHTQVATSKDTPVNKTKDNVLAKILIMDDEDIVRNVVRAMLSHLGYEVECALNGEEALKKYQEAMQNKTPFDLVIFDLTIPGGMGGKEAIVKLHEIDPHAKCIVSSGYSNDLVVAHYDKYGFNGAVNKPYQIEALKKAVSEVLYQK